MASSKARWGYAAKPANKGFHARLLPTVSCPVKVSLTADLGTKYRTRRGTTAAMKAPPTIIRKPKGGTACGVKANGKIMIKAPHLLGPAATSENRSTSNLFSTQIRIRCTGTNKPSSGTLWVWPCRFRLLGGFPRQGWMVLIYSSSMKRPWAQGWTSSWVAINRS